MPEMREFCDVRPGLAGDYVQDYFNLEKQVELTLKTYPEGAGKIKINTITPENLPWEGWYYKGVAVDLEIVPAEGFEFKGWQSLRQLEALVSEPNIQVDFEESDEITAYFVAPYQGLNPQLSPNPAGEEIELDYELNGSTAISVEVYASDGRLLLPVYEGTQGGGFHRLSINTADLAAGMYLCRIKTDGSIRNLKFIRL